MTGAGAASRRWRGDRGAGTVLALAIVAATTIATIAVLGVAAALAVRHRAATAADAAALAAADVVLGAVTGEPCARAEHVASANGFDLFSCRVEGAEAVVAVRTEVLGVAVEVQARAGAPR